MGRGLTPAPVREVTGETLVCKRYQCEEVVMAKLHARPSLQYRYEHYDPRF
jgi:hypothetical protein